MRKNKLFLLLILAMAAAMPLVAQDDNCYSCQPGKVVVAALTNWHQAPRTQQPPAMFVSVGKTNGEAPLPRVRTAETPQLRRPDQKYTWATEAIATSDSNEPAAIKLKAANGTPYNLDVWDGRRFLFSLPPNNGGDGPPTREVELPIMKLWAKAIIPNGSGSVNYMEVKPIPTEDKGGWIFTLPDFKGREGGRP